mmetsp:Transcript_22427/g.25966  ORF Transcript_22427/g.25966 Transcript_22427/m.25966 type:complete len:236 (+) Transcript_22427:31-738(+)
MPDLINDVFVSESAKGNIEAIRKMIAQGASTKYKDKDGNTCLNTTTGGNHVEAMRFLIENGADINNANNEGNTPLHLACEKGHKEAIFFLLVNGADPLLKNGRDEKPGQNNPEIEFFVNSILSEKKAFKALKEDKREKLKQMFCDIDKECKNAIDLTRSKEFNKFTEVDISDDDALKDAKEFIESVAVCNKNTVNLDEWLFAFSKLAVAEPKLLTRFINDYEAAVERNGSFALYK